MMNSMNKRSNNYINYKELIKPFWAPPSWVFSPVWTVLYAIIFVSFGYVFYQYSMGAISFALILPFILNLLFNFAFTPIQFGLKNLPLASVDILLTVATLLWALTIIYPVYPWVAYVNIPYALWALFATTVQHAMTYLNRK